MNGTASNWNGITWMISWMTSFAQLFENNWRVWWGPIFSRNILSPRKRKFVRTFFRKWKIIDFRIMVEQRGFRWIFQHETRGGTRRSGLMKNHGHTWKLQAQDVGETWGFRHFLVIRCGTQHDSTIKHCEEYIMLPSYVTMKKKGWWRSAKSYAAGACGVFQLGQLYRFLVVEVMDPQSHGMTTPTAHPGYPEALNINQHKLDLKLPSVPSDTTCKLEKRKWTFRDEIIERNGPFISHTMHFRSLLN